MKKIITTLLFIFVFAFALASCDANKETFKVTFDAQNGDIEVRNVESGQTVAKPSDPTKAGFLFQGWFTDLANDKEYDFSAKVTKSFTLYAKWFDESTAYTVSFETFGGSSVASKTVSFNTKLGEVATPEKPFQVFDKWYKDAELKEAFDLNTAVTSDLVLYAGYKTVYVLGTALNASYATYKQNTKEQLNELIEFKVRDHQYVVGTMNAWDAKPVLELASYDEVLDDYEDCDIPWEFTLSLLCDGAEVDANLYLDVFDIVNATLDFNEEAIGHVFTVKIVPVGLTNKQKENIAKYTSEYVVEVQAGYNIYEAYELSLMENREHYTDYYTSTIEIDHKAVWDAYKEEHGIALDFNPSALIFHSDIVLDASSVPSAYFYSDANISSSDSDYERALGSLIDYVNLYYHKAPLGEDFIIYGNYFNLDASQIREVQRDDNEIVPEGTVVSHATLLRFGGEGSITMRDLSVSGNAPRVENSVKAGGIIFNKYDGADTLLDNLLCFDFFISFMPNCTPDQVTISNAKVVNAYNSFLYNWGSPNVTVKNSDFSSSGGPVIIQDCVRYGKEDQSTGKTVFENCHFNSFVTGQETWFVGFNATALVGQIKALDLIFNAFGRSFLKTNSDGATYFNLISVNKSGESEGITNSMIDGSIKINDLSAFDFGATDPYLAGLLQAGFSYGAPVFQGSNSTLGTGYGLFNGSSLIDVTNNPITDPSNPLFTSDYIALYYGGMCMVFELFNVGEAYNG